MYHNYADSSHSRGVAIWINERVIIKVLNIHSMKGSRCLLLNIELNNTVTSLVCVYAPNKELERCLFFDEMKEWIVSKSIKIRNLILAGDFNCCLETADRNINSHLKDKSRTVLRFLVTYLDLVDTGYVYGSASSMYTWQERNIKSR